MPQIIVTARDRETTVLLKERVSATDFESEKFAANLVERLGWAVVDAAEAEEEEEEAVPRPQRAPGRRITGGAERESEPESGLQPVGSA